jgi:hypothetical protein
MKLTGKFSFLLAPLLLASGVFAQTIDERAANTVSGSDEIPVARSQYTRTTGTSSDSPPEAKDDNTVAQFPRARPGTQFPRQGGYSRGRYQTPWMDHGSPGHVLIGAAIGFGIGAALGAKNSTQNGTPVSGGIIIGGGLFGLIGGCVGGAIGSSYGWPHPFAHRRLYRPSWPGDDDESARQSHPNDSHRERSTPKPASSSQVARSEATAQPASITPPVSNPVSDFGKAGTLTDAIRISQ